MSGKPSNKFKAQPGAKNVGRQKKSAQLKETSPTVRQKKSKIAVSPNEPRAKTRDSGIKSVNSNAQRSDGTGVKKRVSTAQDPNKARGAPKQHQGTQSMSTYRKSQRPGYLSRVIRKYFGRFITLERIQLQTLEAKETAEALGLTNYNLTTLRNKYDEIDLDGSGEIDRDEFFGALKEQRSPFTDGLFNLIDADGSGTVEFEEYVQVLATYCMYTKEDVLKFCFDLFDVDGSGTIDEGEFVELVKCVNNASPMFPGNFGNAIQMFDVNDDGLIDFNEFIDIDRRFPLVLFPAFRLQDRMQKMTLGGAEWKSINEAVVRCTRQAEYRAKHGREMPESFWRKHFGCLFDNRRVDVERINASRPAAVLRAQEKSADIEH